ncbi:MULTISPECIES: alpha/beta fold hydrolase [Nitrospirillum]|uniref:Pimeloyl-ACP methyl ester carboxylesterase n=1 Tax=Nitrospirillum amazonense TaxID=28077 RepID=A0A560G3W9_9PROT|nr:alpha/beta hydrolase [Nitrospirillum amazonense]MEC4594105.1 alpha/beta hydrolase [Nitrospirillum amazonense]TWB28430.1 pimeloyl-ACP methyl ester carboxylesterase [Nitrospirillum amazonense]
MPDTAETQPIATTRLVVTPDTVMVRDGRPPLSLLVHEGGARADTTVFLCHGSGGNKNQWRHQWAALVEAGVRIVAWDFVGHGQSPQPRDWAAYQGSHLVADYRQILETYGQGRIILAGHSYGCRLTLSLLHGLAAEGRLDRVAAALLLGPPSPVAQLGANPLSWLPPFILEWIRPIISAKFRSLAWHPDTDAALLAFEEQATKGNSLFMMKALMSQAAHPDPAALSALTLPITVVAGANDGLTPPAGARDLAGRLPNATYVELERCGHQIMLEKPAETNALLLGLVNG